MGIFGIFKFFSLCEQMEQSLSLLTFKGSITEAIIEAKRQKKLFVVYISGKRFCHIISAVLLLWSFLSMDIRVVLNLLKCCALVIHLIVFVAMEKTL
jgi:hypothetical protein